MLPAVIGIAVGVGVTVAFKYGIGAHAGITAWLQAIANASLVVAAVIAGLAALIARQSFMSQEGTAHRQLALANEEAARQVAADEHERHHKSMNLVLKFIDDWNADKMLRWRSELAVGLLEQLDGTGPLSDDARVALGEVADFIDLVGYASSRISSF